MGWCETCSRCKREYDTKYFTEFCPWCYVSYDELKARYEKANEEFFLKVVRDWKHFWMNQTHNSPEDQENYFSRAIGVDANMTHHLAKMLRDTLKELGEIDA